ncbi:hypothetical protein MKUB_11910 [Mycobacterium kubicae]|uniref:Uncharacterized protein n=1 Tax=Mycobacterium kubicae TaxID=120959 RepID=A0ABQ1BJ70_9MYCO|nr:hypothetical protein AWC13_23850 [Mycobacterium kubicae]GFG63701.1 hypothetical protein MKUB_11910 [Mycobacterium kubicae]
MDVSGYLGLFGEPGRALTDEQWIKHANHYLTPNLFALNAEYLTGSRSEQWLRMSYRPGPGAFNFAQLSGGSIAEMLDQTATHCGSLVTGHPCPTLSITVNILRGGTTKACGHGAGPETDQDERRAGRRSRRRRRAPNRHDEPGFSVRHRSHQARLIHSHPAESR